MSQDVILETDPCTHDEWMWKMDWCVQNRMNPHLTWVWDAATQAYKNDKEEGNG